MLQNYKLTIAYDGSAYHGWQIQPHGPTIQGAIEKALESIVPQKCRLTASGRTDAGVHALGQVAHVVADTRLSAARLLQAVNSLLPSDIAIVDCETVSAEFHARFSAQKKRYRYRILNQPHPNPIGRQYVWQIFQPLDFEAMRAATEYFVGEHDFKTFESSGSPRSHTIRQVFTANWDQPRKKHLVFEIEANGFLKQMVRNIVGTVVDVGKGRFQPETIPHMLSAKDRAAAGPTAPATGLFLVAVTY